MFPIRLIDSPLLPSSSKLSYLDLSSLREFLHEGPFFDHHKKKDPRPGKDEKSSPEPLEPTIRRALSRNLREKY